jgi:type II secretory pathway pseudopilin PulG
MCEKVRLTRTGVIVQCLDQLCRTYQNEYGEYPPSRPDLDSRVLHQYFGSPRKGKNADGTVIQLPPIFTFPLDWLGGNPSSPLPFPPVSIVDGWGRPIRYANPGRYNFRAVDIWSTGKNGKDDLDSDGPDSDDITNWPWGLKPKADHSN